MSDIYQQASDFWWPANPDALQVVVGIVATALVLVIVVLLVAIVVDMVMGLFR